MLKTKIGIFIRPLLITVCILSLYSTAGAAFQGLQVGMEAPEFSLKTTSGDSRKLSEMKVEKLTAIVFWSTWSAKSEKLLLRMQKLYEKYKGSGFDVIAINVDGQQITPQTLVNIKAMSEKLKLGFPVLVDEGLNVFHDYGVIALPSTLLIDKNRIIAYEISGYPLIEAEVMADFITNTVEGKAAVAAIVQTGYQPEKTAVRFFNMGRTTLKSKRMADTAESWFKKAIEADAKFVLPYLGLGKLYAQKGDMPQARKAYQDALDVAPDQVIALCEMGMLLANEGKLDEANALLSKAMKVGESYTPCYYYTGFAYGKAGRLDEALKMFDEALKIDSTDYNAYLFKARMYEEKKKESDAAEAYRKALELILNLGAS